MKPLKILAAVAAVLATLVLAAVGTLYALFDPARIKAELAAAAQQKYHRQLDLGTLELSVWPNLGITLDKLVLSEPNAPAPFLQLDSARVAVAVMPLLAKRVVVNAIEVNGLQATLVKHRDGSLNVADLAGSSAAKPEKKVDAGATPLAVPVNLDVAAIKISNAQLTWRDEKTGATTVLSNLDLNTGRIRADSSQQTLEVDAISFAARAQNAKQTASATLALSKVEGRAQALKIGKLALTLDAKLSAAEGDTVIQGNLESPVAVNLAAKTFALEKLAGTLSIANPRMPMKQVKLPLSGSARVDGLKQMASLELDTTFDESKISAKLGAAKFEPLALVFDIDINQLNVDKYLPPTPPNKAPASTDEKIDFSAIKPLNLNGTIKIGSLQVKRVKLSNLNAKIVAAGGRLNVAPLTLNLYAGSASGSLAVNANDNAITFKQTLANVSINPLLKDLADKDLVEGRGNVTLDLATQGPTVSGLKQALSGSASLSLKDGAVKGINLAQSLRDAKAKLGVGATDTTQPAKTGEKTDFSELTASFKIARGVAHNDDLSMKSPFLRLTGVGDIDIAGRSINYLARTSVVGSMTGQGGKGADQLTGLTVPVRISGPFDKLSYTLELGSLVSDTAKAKVAEKTQEIKARAEEQIKSQFKGLFGK